MHGTLGTIHGTTGTLGALSLSQENSEMVPLLPSKNLAIPLNIYNKFSIQINNKTYKDNWNN